jgi:hypothetical protein
VFENARLKRPISKRNATAEPSRETLAALALASLLKINLLHDPTI